MLSSFLSHEKISEYAVLPFSERYLLRPEKFARAFPEGPPAEICVFLIPYRVGDATGRLARFAVSRDYHLYFAALLERAKAAFPTICQGFCDNSPFDERAIALDAALGVRGENGLLINSRYGSYVFIGTFFFSAASGLGTPPVAQQSCRGCGACRRACPTGALCDPTAPCLSELSQKKRISPEEEALLCRYNTLWGCDRCQEVCPENQNTPETPIPFFRNERIADLDEEALDDLLERGAFSDRAYAFRGEKVIRRNLQLLLRAKKS